MPGDYNPTAFARVPTPAPRVEDAAVLPGLNTPYKAFGFVENEVPRLVLVMGKEGFAPGGVAYYFIQYVHLSLGEFGFTANGQVCRFMVADLQPKLLTVHGRNLLRGCDHIALRRMQWIRQADRDFRPVDEVESTEPIITRIVLEDWKPPQGEKAKRHESAIALGGGEKPDGNGRDDGGSD